MFELDLRNAKLLKKFLSVRYKDWELRECADICTLVKMCMSAILGWVFLGMVTALIFYVGIVALSPLVLITMWLPDSLQVSPELVEYGFSVLVAYLIVGMGGILIGMIATFVGNMQFAPEYMKRPLRKLFKRKASLQDDIPPKEKVPSKTWIAIKEMYKSIKDKTCVKVKM